MNSNGTGPAPRARYEGIPTKPGPPPRAVGVPSCADSPRPSKSGTAARRTTEFMSSGSQDSVLQGRPGRSKLPAGHQVGGIPRGAGHLDDNIRIIVDLPRGSEHGPQVSQNLGKWGLKSAPGYRLLLNLAYAWHDVGRTLTPVGKGKDRRWVRSYDPSRYEKFTDNYLIDLAFPTSARGPPETIGTGYAQGCKDQNGSWSGFRHEFKGIDDAVQVVGIGRDGRGSAAG